MNSGNPLCSESPPPAALSSRERQETKQVDPCQLLTRCRLDLILKYLFFRSLGGVGDRAHWEPFYRRHILERTKGVEPRDRFLPQDSSKRSVDDYVSGCEDLFLSFKQRGFDGGFPVPLSIDEKLLNGAHRIACALATDNKISIAPAQLGVSNPWGFRWFWDRGYPSDVLAALLYHYARLVTRATGFLVFWGPTFPYWRELIANFGPEFGLVGWLDFSFEENPSAFESIVHDIYSLQWTDREQANIRRKVILLNQSRRIFRVALVEDLFNSDSSFYEQLIVVRNKIRSTFHHSIPEEAFCTCHASSNEKESKYLLELLLGQGSRKHHLLRSCGRPRDEFNAWLFQLEAELTRHGLSRQNICIVGSSPLEVVGIRNATDIDITVPSRLRKRFGSGVTRLNPWLDIVTEGYPRSADSPPITDDQLIADAGHHFWFRGFRFADVHLVLRRKAWQARPKDIADVRAAGKFFASEAKLPDARSGAGCGGVLPALGCGAPDSFSAKTAATDLIPYLVQREKHLPGGRL